MSAVSVLLGRLPREEGERQLPYDDATGLAVKAPVGNLSWGRGFNLMQCGSPGLFQVMENYLLNVLDNQLQSYSWYTAAGDVRGSVFLDIAYNAGLHGLLGFSHMIADAEAQDWTAAAAECAVADPKLNASRYAPLRALLLSG
jgi:GH24 family phage-related lysozyme (muramidase)